MNLIVEEAEKFINFLIDHDLTADQFLFCLLLSSEADGYQDLPDKNEAMSNFFRYYNTVAKDKENPVWAKQDLDELVDKGFICRSFGVPEDSYSYDDFEVTEEFLDLAFQKREPLMEKFNEFWSEYPARYESEEGKKFNIKAINKEEVWDIYQDKIQEVDDPDVLVQTLKVAKTKNEVDCRIDKWLNSHQWEAYIDDIGDAVEHKQTEQTVL